MLDSKQDISNILDDESKTLFTKNIEMSRPELSNQIDTQHNELEYTKRETEIEEPTKKQSSLVVIFSAWNTMIGAAVTTLPWAY